MRLRILALVFFPCLGWAQPSSVLHGTVRDSTGAALGSATVVLASSNGSRQSEQVNSAGEFRFGVSPGTYMITVDVPQMFTYRRAPITIGPGQDVYVHVVPRIRILSAGINADGSEIVTQAPSPHYASMKISEADPHVLIEFGRKVATNDETVKYENAVLTFQDWTISADFIVIDSKLQQIRPSGNVKADHGLTRLANSTESEVFQYADLTRR